MNQAMNPENLTPIMSATAVLMTDGSQLAQVLMMKGTGVLFLKLNARFFPRPFPALGELSSRRGDWSFPAAPLRHRQRTKVVPGL